MADETENKNDIATLAEATAATLIAAGIIELPKKRRKRTNWESSMAYEYVNRFYPDKPHWTRIELGPIPNGEGNMIYARTRRWCDAVIIEDDHVILIETKMRPKPDVVGQIRNYATLFAQTPLFKRFREMPLRLRVVAALVDDEIKAFIEANGIEVEVFKPSNYDEWYELVVKNNYGYRREEE